MEPTEVEVIKFAVERFAYVAMIAIGLDFVARLVLGLRAPKSPKPAPKEEPVEKAE
jgi:hypothetical protein